MKSIVFKSIYEKKQVFSQKYFKLDEDVESFLKL